MFHVHGRIEEPFEAEAQWLHHRFGLDHLERLIVDLDAQNEKVDRVSGHELETGVEAVPVIMEWYVKPLSESLSELLMLHFPVCTSVKEASDVSSCVKFLHFWLGRHSQISRTKLVQCNCRLSEQWDVV